MRTKLRTAEARLLLAVGMLLAVAALCPPLAQSPFQHEFADERSLWGVPHAMDVLSNLGFAAAGLTGGWLLWRAPPRAFTNMQRAMTLLFFGGLVLMALGSAAYHLDPSDATLAVDRYCMVPAFAGLLGLVAAGRVGERAGAALGLAAVAFGLVSVKLWSATGNLLPWAVFQFGGLLLLWWLASLQPLLRALPVQWSPVLLAYGAGRLLELNDFAIHQLTDELVSGHTLAHVAASMTAWPMLGALIETARSRQNASDIAIADDVAIRWWSNA